MGEVTGGLEIIGGVGGTAVNLAELEALGGTLERAADHLEDARSRMHRGLAVAALGANLAPASAERARAALSMAGATLGRLSAEVADVAARLARAREAYGTAERVTLDDLMGRILGLDRVVSPLPAPIAPVDRARLALLAPSLVLAMLPWGTAQVTLRRADVGEQTGRPPDGVGDLMRGIDALYPASGGPPGAVGVTRIESADGAVSWAVLVPGTQTLAPGGSNPYDDATNAQAYVGVPTAAMTAVVGALAAAGARPREPVLLAGHSQGGMTAMRLAADPEVRRRFRITAVVTAGSPVGHMATPPGVSALHLEHAQDPTPALDATEPPDEVDRVTVRRSLAGTGESAHATSSYAHTGDLVDAATHPSVVEWRQRAGEVLGGPGALATSTVYVAERGSDQ